MSGRFICFEGGDGAGKTTLGRHVTEALLARGAPVVFVEKREEGFGGAFLEERLMSLRALLWDYSAEAPIHEWGDHHWFHLLVSWFSLWDTMRIRPLVDAGHWVVVDGWIYKYVARFQLKPRFPPEHLRRCCEHLSVPETILLDVESAVAAGRREAFKATESGALDGHGDSSRAGFVAYQARVREGLRGMAAASGWSVLDGTLSEEAVVQEALRVLLGHPAVR